MSLLMTAYRYHGDERDGAQPLPHSKLDSTETCSFPFVKVPNAGEGCGLVDVGKSITAP
ncbi:hypothetical protein ABH926_000991 [Catenulispora sp. GP43]